MSTGQAWALAIIVSFVYTLIVLWTAVWILRAGLRPTQRAVQAQARETGELREELAALRQTVADVGVALHGGLSRSVASRQPARRATAPDSN